MRASELSALDVGAEGGPQPRAQRQATAETPDSSRADEMCELTRAAQLVDFGFAKTLRHVSYMKTQCGSPWLVTRTAIAARACRARLPGCGRTPPLIISRQRLSRTL